MEAQVNTVKVSFEQTLNQLEQAAPVAKNTHQAEVFQRAIELAQTEEGLKELFQYAARFDQAGVFKGGPWEDASKLQAPLVGGTLKLQGVNSIVELLSELRMLAIAKGIYQHDEITAEEAKSFLESVLALNLDILFPPETEEARINAGEQMERAKRLFHFLGNELSFQSIAKRLAAEIDRLTIQRPIMVHRIINMIAMSKQICETDMDEQVKETLQKYIDAISTPTQLSKKTGNLKEYKLALTEALADEVEKEAIAFAQSMQETGLVSPYHAVLIRCLANTHSEILPTALNLSELGQALLNDQLELVQDLITMAIHPQTAQSIYGLAKILNKGLLSQEPLSMEIRRLLEIEIHPEVEELLLPSEMKEEGLTANAILVAGAISVLGQPLGVGQGLNPTCQSARAISLWAQHDASRLLELIIRAARDNDVDMTFEGDSIHSSLLTEGVASEIHQELDPVSKILVPHLDKIYNEMMKRTALRNEDGHKWVNPEFYGERVQRGFANIIDPVTGSVVNYSGFVRMFYATHHPAFNDGYELIYPNPVGIYVTDVHGNLLGLHAISIQRVAMDEGGVYRVYFYNPNNDSGQNWGQGIEPSLKGHGEEEGEASLPFDQFAARLYAFHYNPYEKGDGFELEEEVIQRIETLARESWGRQYTWLY
ncbi:hypothetical protein D1B33_12305 [Lysinibacillus yapensis]|uniref:Uncharacterized protein n=1 Tax=Ureibacillus yapensis TaxID=2304605 RepID=A0A396S9T5_9BACL|nr:hypothetical protein [Lysinibacillus yapensis]RHW35875.1 hypothetical protein D1B33_12305 [Lysinibacillus yapensis]